MKLQTHDGNFKVIKLFSFSDASVYISLYINGKLMIVHQFLKFGKIWNVFRIFSILDIVSKSIQLLKDLTACLVSICFQEKLFRELMNCFLFSWTPYLEKLQVPLKDCSHRISGKKMFVWGLPRQLTSLCLSAKERIHRK